MVSKKNLKNNQRGRRRYRAAIPGKFTKRIVKKMTSDEEYLADIEQLKKDLSEIENKYYASDIKIEQIEKNRGYKIILSKIAKIFTRKPNVRETTGDNDEK